MDKVRLEQLKEKNRAFVRRKHGRSMNFFRTVSAPSGMSG